MSAAFLDLTCGSPFTRSLAEFAPSVSLRDLVQLRTVPIHDATNINFVVFFRHNPTFRVFAYDLLTNTWSDVTEMRDWNVPQLSYGDPYAHPFDTVSSRLR